MLYRELPDSGASIAVVTQFCVGCMQPEKPYLCLGFIVVIHPDFHALSMDVLPASVVAPSELC